MHVVETLVALVELSLTVRPTPVSLAFQLVLQATGASRDTSRSAVADVLAEPAAASIVQRFACIPQGVTAEALLAELSSWAWAAGAGGGGGGGGPGEPRAGTGFGMGRVVPLDALVAFVAVVGNGSLEERTRAAFWTLDRDGAGYLLQDQLLRLTQLLVAVAAAGRLLLGLPALAPESQQPAATAAAMSPMDGAVAGGMPSPSAGGSGGPRSHGAQGPVHDASRGLLEEALLRAFREHAVHDPSGVAPPRLTAERLALVVQSAAAHITLAVVQKATSAPYSYAQHLPPHTHAHPHAQLDTPLPSAGPSGSSLRATLSQGQGQAHGQGQGQTSLQAGSYHRHTRNLSSSSQVTGGGGGGGGGGVGFPSSLAHSRSNSHGHGHGQGPPYGGVFAAGGQQQHQFLQRPSGGSGPSQGGMSYSRSPSVDLMQLQLQQQQQQARGPSEGGAGPFGGTMGAAGYTGAGGPAAGTNASPFVQAPPLAAAAALGSRSRQGSTELSPHVGITLAPAGPSLGPLAAAAGTLAASGPSTFTGGGSAGVVPTRQSISLGGAAPLQQQQGPPDGQGQFQGQASGSRSFGFWSATASVGGALYGLAVRSAAYLSTTSQLQPRSQPTQLTQLQPPLGPVLPPQGQPSDLTAAWDPEAGPLDSRDYTARRQLATQFAASQAPGLPPPPPAAAAAIPPAGSRQLLDRVSEHPADAFTTTSPSASPSATNTNTTPGTSPSPTSKPHRLSTAKGAGTMGGGEVMPTPGSPDPSGLAGAGAALTTHSRLSRSHTASGLAGQGAGDAWAGGTEGLASAGGVGGGAGPGAGAGPGTGTGVTSSWGVGAAFGRKRKGAAQGVGAGGGAAAGGSVTSGGAAGGRSSLGLLSGRWRWRRQSGAAGGSSILSSPGDISALGAGSALSTAAAAAGPRGGSGTALTPPSAGGPAAARQAHRHSHTASGAAGDGWAAASYAVGPWGEMAAAGGGGGGGPGGLARTEGGEVGGYVTADVSPRKGGYTHSSMPQMGAGTATNLMLAYASTTEGAAAAAAVSAGGGGGGAGGYLLTADATSWAGSAAAAAAAGRAARPLPLLLAGQGESPTGRQNSTFAHEPHSLEDMACRAEDAAKAEAQAAATRGAAAAVVGGAGVALAAGSREAGGGGAAAGGIGGGGGSGAGGGGQVLPPLQRTIRSSVQQAGVRLFLHCGVCLLSIIALLLLDAALVAWVYLDRRERLSTSLVIVAATNAGLVLLVLGIAIVRSWLAAREAAAAAAEQAARSAAAAAADGGAGGGGGGVIEFVVNTFVAPALRTIGIARGPDTPGGPGGGDGGASGWGSRLRVLWTTIGRVAGFDAAQGPSTNAIGSPSDGVGGDSAITLAQPPTARAGPGAASYLTQGGGSGATGLTHGSVAGQHPAAISNALYVQSSYDGRGSLAGRFSADGVGMGALQAGTGTGGGPGDAMREGGEAGGGGGGGGGMQARQRTRGQAVPGAYHAHVDARQRVEEAYPAM